MPKVRISGNLLELKGATFTLIQRMQTILADIMIVLSMSDFHFEDHL